MYQWCPPQGSSSFLCSRDQFWVPLFGLSLTSKIFMRCVVVVYWYFPRLSLDEGLSFTPEGWRHSQNCFSFPKRHKTNVRPIPLVAGQIDSSNGNHPSRVPLYSSQPHETPKPDGHGLKPKPSVSRTLEGQCQGLSVLRCSFGLTPLPQGGSGDRFLPLRLRACVDPQGSQGDL